MNAIYDYEGKQIFPINELDGLEDILPNRLLVWHDEFKGNEINPAKWKNLYGLSRSIQSYAEDIKKVTTVSDGLSYRCVKDNPSSGIPYSSAYLTTKDRFEFMYGRIEAKMRFPSASPYHSTFWTLGANTDKKLTDEFTAWDATVGVKFPSCGEIDIAEFNDGTVGARTHWATNGFDTDATVATGGNIASLTDTPTSWHIYSCEWTSSAITFYIDGVQKGTWATSNGAVNGWNPFNHPHFLILNNVFSTGNTPTWDIAQTDVAWVRVYAPADVTEYIAETAISIPTSASIAVGERHWLGTPTFTPANPSDMTVQWLSHNEDIVTCYGGMLIGVSAGTTYVQATSKHGYTALCKVTVS